MNIDAKSNNQETIGKSGQRVAIERFQLPNITNKIPFLFSVLFWVNVSVGSWSETLETFQSTENNSEPI